LTTSKSDDSHRPIRSYVIRGGRLTDSQRKAIDQHWQEYVIDYQQQSLPWDELFPQPAPLTVEIGFGMGDSLLAMAEADPATNFLGIEVHKPGVGKLIHGLVEKQLSNVRIMCHDATEVVQHCMENGAIDRFLIFFPDPWHKKRHHKRRLIQAPLVSLLANRLHKGGSIHLATDWQNYAEHMLDVMEAEPTLSNANGPNQYWPNPNRPETKFERRGQRLGHGVWDLLYKKS
jgi:tRNA (guanine-N7-)-methyltransferase